MPVQVGESIGHYQVVRELGVGANGRVLQVEHLITRRREAMKILANGKPSSQEYAHRFLREIRLQASLDHPNIAAVLNAFWLGDDLVMIMELIEGETLQDLLPRRRLSLEQGISFIRQVLEALAYSHKNGVIHRDVSAANIIVTPNGRLKLTDFGLAKGAADLTLTEGASMSGSPYYISPEQVRGTAAIDLRSDIYSAGVVLYELLTGSRPFEAASSFLLMQAHVQQAPQPPIERNPAIPGFISDAILKALAKNPWERFQSAEEFLAAVDGPAVEAPALDSLFPPSAAGSPPLESEPSFTYGVTPNYADVEFEESLEERHPQAKRSVAPKAPIQPHAKPSFLRAIWNHPITGAIIGVAAVLAAVAPVLLYDFESGRPRYWVRDLKLPVISIPAPPAPELQNPKTSPNNDLGKTKAGTASPGAPAKAIVLTPGPKTLPVLPQPGARQTQSASRPAAKQRATTPPPPTPTVTIWGDAQSKAQPARPTQP